MEEENQATEMMIVIILGFLCLGMSLLTCMSIKSSIGFLSVIHNNLPIFGTVSVMLGIATVYADKTLLHVDKKKKKAKAKKKDEKVLTFDEIVLDK